MELHQIMILAFTPTNPFSSSFLNTQKTYESAANNTLLNSFNAGRCSINPDDFCRTLYSCNYKKRAYLTVKFCFKISIYNEISLKMVKFIPSILFVSDKLRRYFVVGTLRLHCLWLRYRWKKMEETLGSDSIQWDFRNVVSRYYPSIFKI